MPKENKSTNRKSRRQYSDIDNENISSVRDPLISTVGINRYSPFLREAPARDSRKTKEKMTVPTIETLHSLRGGIIENGIKYIMFPLHLLRFCIFGTSFSGSVDCKEHAEDRHQEATDRKEKKEKPRSGEKDDEEKKTRKEEKEEDARKGSSSDKSSAKPKSSRSTSPSRNESEQPTTRNKDCKGKKDNERPNDEMVTAEEDSDSSNEQWSSASSTMPMNMSLEYDNIDRFMSCSILEEPMDISIDEHSFNKNSTKSIPQQKKSSAGIRNNAVRGKSTNSYIDAQESNFSVDEEIARIFQKQCTSSEDEFSSSSFPKSFAACKYEKPKETNFLYKKANSNYSPVSSRSRKGSKHDTERKKKTTTEFVANNKRRKVILDEDGNEKDIEHWSGEKTPEGKRNSRLEIPTRYKSRSPRTPVKDKGSKRKNIKYKETATQTDSAFSTDDDVEMVPVDTKSSDRQFYSKYINRKARINLFQGKEFEQELNYIADNEDSNDGFSRIARKRVSSCSTSSSSTDLGFDERASATPDRDITTGQRHTNSSNNINTLRTCARAPPGFPQLPQNPPLMPFIYDSTDFILAPSKNYDDTNSSLIKTMAGVPPAPSPMRHLYYDYPEFMDLPIYVNSSKILNNILKNNYYR